MSSNHKKFSATDKIDSALVRFLFFPERENEIRLLGSLIKARRDETETEFGSNELGGQRDEFELRGECF